MSEEIERFKPRTETGSDTRVIQSDKDAADINRMIAEMVSGGSAPRLNTREGVFADVSTSGDLAHHLDMARQANELFMSMPARVRAECENDVVAFLDVVMNDPGRLQALGLVLEGEGATPDPADAGGVEPSLSPDAEAPPAPVPEGS